jgi:GT2 family glycosyltransferase
VPSRLATPTSVAASVIVVATDAADDLERQLAALASAVADDVQRIVVANGPSAEQETALVGWQERWAAERGEADPEVDDLAASTEVVWLASRQGVAAALNAGIRRAAGSAVVVLGPGVEPGGDFITPLVAALADPAVAVTGPWGLASDDQRHFEPADDGTPVAAIDLDCLAFRRADAADRGPLDERFEGDALLGAWWSLVLRDAGEDQPSRRAAVVDVPVTRSAAAPHAEDPAERRNRYRFLDRFGNRTDLAVT